VTCFTAPLFARAWWQIVTFRGVVVVVVLVVVIVVTLVLVLLLVLPVDDVKSGVVVVIVVTTGVLPVVIVVTKVVVASAPNGDAPAVKTAVAAPSVISTANRTPVKTLFFNLPCLIPAPFAEFHPGVWPRPH
jgi:hypothetical protein